MPKAKSRRKNPRGRRRAAAKASKRRMKKRFPGQQVISGPAGDGIKMSDVLGQFVEPYKASAQTEDAYRKLITLAVVAWNVTLFPEQERESHLEKLLEVFPGELRDDGRKIIRELMHRKERFFPHHKRMIMGFELTDTGTSWHLSVMSTAMPV
jgi:hypothetical protein